MNRIYLLLFLSGFFLNCNNPTLSLEEQVAILNKDSTKFPYYQAFDTLAYLKSLNIKDEVNLLPLIKTYSLDTFELVLTPSMIPFGYWYNKKANQDSSATFSIYPTPCSKNIALPTGLASYSSVTFIGRLSPNSDKPVPELIYFYYKIKKPFLLYENKMMGFKINGNKDGIDSSFGFSFIQVN